MLGILVGLLTAMTWASGSILMKDLSEKLDPFTLNAPRTLVGGMAMVIIVMLTGRDAGLSDVTARKLFFMLGSMGVGGGIGDAFYVSSLARIGVSRAFPIASVYPALTLILGLLFLNEVISLGMVGGLLLVTTGVVLISRWSSGPAQTDRSVTGRGISFALVAAMCWAVSMIMIAPGIEGLDPILVAAVRVPALSLVLWSVVLVRGTWRRLLALTASDWWKMLVGGLIGWGLGSLMFVMTVSLIGPTQAAIITSTSPMFALPLSMLFLRERPHRGVLLGTALTVFGVVMVS